jgi:hypothetical protein
MLVCRNGIVFRSIDIYSTSSNNTIAVEASLHLPNFHTNRDAVLMLQKMYNFYPLRFCRPFLYDQLLVYVALLPFPSVASIECSTSLMSSESILL